MESNFPPLTVDDARMQLMGEDIGPMAAEEAEETGETETVEGSLDQTGDTLPEDEPRLADEGTVGLGIDIVEIERMKNILQRRPAFADQVFSEEERAYCRQTANPPTHYAMRFAAKEAVVKALGTGFSRGIWVRDIEVLRAKNGRPSVKLSGRAKDVAEEQGVCELSLSMSYTKRDAVACAMAVTEASLKATEKRNDPMEELARQFKETRKILDEL